MKLTIRTVFDKYHYLNVSAVARYIGISPTLLRQYSAGIKEPSADRRREIEMGLHQIAEDIKKIRL